MSWWMVPLIVLAAPVLLLALIAWVLDSAFRRICAAVAPWPIQSDEDLPAIPEPCRHVTRNRTIARRLQPPIAVGGELERCSLN